MGAAGLSDPALPTLRTVARREARTLRQLRVEAQHEPRLNGVREGRAGLVPGASGSGRRDRGCPQLGSSEVMWVAHGSSSSPPRTTETSPVWGLCLWGFLKQDFGKTREASRVPSLPPPTPPPAEPLLCDREASSEGTEGAFVTLPMGHTHCAMRYLGMSPCPSSLAPGTRGLVASEGHSLAPAAEEEQLCHCVPAPCSSISPAAAGRGILHASW